MGGPCFLVVTAQSEVGGEERKTKVRGPPCTDNFQVNQRTKLIGLGIVNISLIDLDGAVPGGRPGLGVGGAVLPGGQVPAGWGGLDQAAGRRAAPGGNRPPVRAAVLETRPGKTNILIKRNNIPTGRLGLT